MTDRYTRKDAERALEMLCSAAGGQYSTRYADKGAWTLDYNPTYGGCVVHENLASGGVTEPMGSARRTPQEFCAAVNFAIRVLESQK